ncbi:MAG: malectin domain-containing carbohydrate-binding protein, partial [Candidatus Geothermincolia bacterium]
MSIARALLRACRYLLPAAAICLAVLLLFSGRASAAAPGQVIVELQQNNGRDLTCASSFAVPIRNTDNSTRQQYKFQRERQGTHFTYIIANLEPGVAYAVELSLVEHDFNAAESRRFNVYVQSARVIENLDIFSAVGADSAFQQTTQATADPRGLLSVKLRSDEAGCTGRATVSTLRVSRGGVDIVEIDASASRNNMTPPVRHYNTAGQNTYEAVLGRLGARASLDLLPQRLASRFSTLGTWTGDLSELVVALKYGSNVRALPLTDRFPVWDTIEQSQTMTSQSFECSSGSMPLRISAVFRAPFYPQNEKVSSAPFFYIDITVQNAGTANASGVLMLAKPHKEEFAAAGIEKLSDGAVIGVTSRTSYNYRDETFNACDAKGALEAIALPASESAGVVFRGARASEFAGFTPDSLWGWTSPAGYPATANDPRNPVFSFYPRGYSGCSWTIGNLAPGASTTRHFVLAGYTSENILSVSNSSFKDSSYKFRYCGSFGGVQDVVHYAVSDRTAGDDLLGKSSFFDSTVSSDEYLALDPAYEGDVRNLMACSFQTFLTNTWWARSGAGRDWFSVWEGTWMRFHGTVDVEYN